MINYTSLLQLLIFFLLLNLFFYINIDKLTKIFSIYDESKSRLKNSKKKISLIGGTIIFANIFCYFLFNKIFNFDVFIEQLSKIETFTFFFLSYHFFISLVYMMTNIKYHHLLEYLH